jgi:hypothetical protein
MTHHPHLPHHTAGARGRAARRQLNRMRAVANLPAPRRDRIVALALDELTREWGIVAPKHRRRP